MLSKDRMPGRKSKANQEVNMAKSKPTLKYPDRKISDTFLQFAEPLLDAFGPNATECRWISP